MLDKRHPFIIKIGSSVLTGDDGRLDEGVIRALVDSMARMMAEGYKICLVSSGAIAAGKGALDMARAPKRLRYKQALAAVGQVRLMNVYQKWFSRHQLHVGQILLSHHDLSRRESFLNTRATLQQLFELNILPIINENDTVATEEIQFGDNDQLAVLLANVLEARTVVFLSSAGGLLNPDLGQRIPVVEHIDSHILSMARGTSAMGTGGMGSKLMAIKKLTEAGKACYLVAGKKKDCLMELAAGNCSGTFFVPHQVASSSKKQWMQQHLKPHGRIFVDEGALKALKHNKASLLVPGIKDFDGQWNVGDLVCICMAECEFARGMARCSSRQLSQVLGKNRDEVAIIMGHAFPRFVVHKDDIVLLDDPL